MHLDDEHVQRLVHGELSAAADASARQHLAGCSTCRDRVAEAKRDEDEIDTLLRTLDHQPPPVSAGAVAARALARPSRWRRRVAGLLVAMGVAGAAYALPGSPVPRWVESVVERIGSLRAPASRVPESAEIPVPAVKQPGVGGIAVAPGARLLILITERQAEGRVHVMLTDSADVVVRAPAGAATFTSDVDELVIDNPGSTATFEIEVPRAAPQVEIRVAGDRIFLKKGPRVVSEPATADGTYLLPLKP